MTASDREAGLRELDRDLISAEQRGRAKISPEQLLEMFELYLEHQSLTIVAQKLGVTIKSASRHLRGMGLRLRLPSGNSPLVQDLNAPEQLSQIRANLQANRGETNEQFARSIGLIASEDCDILARYVALRSLSRVANELHMSPQKLRLRIERLGFVIYLSPGSILDDATARLFERFLARLEVSAGASSIRLRSVGRGEAVPERTAAMDLQMVLMCLRWRKRALVGEILGLSLETVAGRLRALGVVVPESEAVPLQQVNGAAWLANLLQRLKETVARDQSQLHRRVAL